MTKKMKKLALVLVWFLIAGWAIFAIQSYASSQDTLPSESEISKLKSTYPANNNRLSAEMRDEMLDFFKRIKIKVSSFENKFVAINNKINTTNTNIWTINSQITSILTRLSGIDKTIEEIKKQLNNLPSGWWTSTDRIENIITTIINRRYYMCKGKDVECDDSNDVYTMMLNNKSDFYTVWRNTINPTTRKNLINKSKKIGDYNFCALSTVANNWSKHICQIFTDWSSSKTQWKTARFLYENSNNGEDGFCSVICF